jgi:hypothetical protein
VGIAGVEHAFENPESGGPPTGQFPPPVIGKGHAAGGPEQTPDDSVERLRADLRALAADLAAFDRRDAAQHGLLHGEIAHLVRRIARLEAIPRSRPGR